MTAQMESVVEQDLVLSGGFGKSSNSARAGFLPIGLDHVPLGALNDIPVYVRIHSSDSRAAALGVPDEDHPGFRLYCTPDIHFTETHRRRLIEHGVAFVYIRMADQSKFRIQTEARLTEIAADPAVAIAEKSAIIYGTSVELVNELLSEPELMAKSPRLEQVSRAITTLVMNNPTAFTHLFAASHHDFYTATHMVNVATWMVPLAFELGYRDPEELNWICQAGVLHDMGKVSVPESILNKKGKLSDEEWAQIKEHPEAGCEYLARFGNIHPIVMAVTGQHHERLDGSGYPKGLKHHDIHPVSRICAVVDSFDAMTAFRPFKERTLSVSAAVAILQKETPTKYDPTVFQAWLRLLRSAGESVPLPATSPKSGTAKAARPESNANRRHHQRKAFHCPARAHILVKGHDGVKEQPATPIVAHSISRGGLGLLSQVPFQIGEFVRVYLQAEGWSGRALDGQTVRCRSHMDNWHEIGLQFGPVEAKLLPSERRQAGA